jgi:hypothetical protein
MGGVFFRCCSGGVVGVVGTPGFTGCCWAWSDGAKRAKTRTRAQANAPGSRRRQFAANLAAAQISAYRMSSRNPGKTTILVLNPKS